MADTLQSAHCRQLLLDGLDSAGLTLDADRVDKLMAYLQQLHKWNRAYNLSGIRDPAQMVSLHLLDSLVLLPHVTGAAAIADVGTGAGLPGIPLAICLPGTRLTLIDSNSKKTRFMFQACAHLGLDNVEVVHSRAEDYAIDPQVAIVTSRAFAALATMVGACRHLLAPAGRFLAMKGQYPTGEIAALPPDCVVAGVHALTVPGVAAERHLVDIRLQ